MKRIILSIVMLAATLPALAWQQRAPQTGAACSANLVYGLPAVTKPDATLICRQGYVTLHDNQAKVPVWTAWVLTPNHINGCVPRSNAFAADQSLPAGKRSDPKDYAGNGYDQGHIANDAHQSWDQQVEYESFLMSNMAPQLPGLNRGIWKLLETATGAWGFSSQHTLQVYAGSVYNVAKDKKIGADQVDVPYGFYKIVIDTNTGATLAFLFPHKENQGNDLTKVQTTVKDIEDNTGIIFPVPAGHNKSMQEPIWPVDFKSVAANKKAVCKGATE
jgi:endonuclease G, mitochondrial